MGRHTAADAHHFLDKYLTGEIVVKVIDASGEKHEKRFTFDPVDETPAQHRTADHEGNGDDVQQVAEQRTVPRPRECRKDILRVLRDAGGRMTAPAICSCLNFMNHVWGERTVENELAAMLKEGIIDNPPEARPRGYALV